jgi:DNA-binding transcriptional LysR family regulator
MAKYPRVDLNLARVFEAVLRTGSVSRAATALGLAQPTVSNALARLRDVTGDDLFVRTKQGMVPTQHAIEVGQIVRDGLQLVDQGLSRTAQFDPRTNLARFRILMSDAGEIIFLPRLMRMLAEQAPNVDLEIIQMPAQDHAGALESGGADLYVGFLAQLRDTHYRLKLYDEGFVIVCRDDHPWTATPPGLEDYLNARHIVVRPPSSVSNPFESLLDLHRRERRQPLILPHFVSLLAVLPGTDDVSTMTQTLAEALVERGPLATVKLPFAAPLLPFGLAWHRRQHLDPRNIWLRKLIASVRWHAVAEEGN